MYKPNFCAECGEKITRSRWRIWTSRRFCSNCEGNSRKARIFLPLIAAASLFSIGLMTGRALRQQPPPLLLQRVEPQAAPEAKEGTDTEAESPTDSSSAEKPEPKYGPDGTATERPTDPNEVVSICGARTQKGTPCRRRVRGTGRCWQHRAL